MPLKWTISHADRSVEAVASGTVSLQEIERYLDDVMVSNALPYRKLFDASEALGPLGALAIVAPATAILRQAQLFAALAPADRPLKIFKTVAAARTWLAAAG